MVGVPPKPGGRALTQSLSFVPHAQDRRGERLRFDRLGDETVLAVLDELGRGAFRGSRHDARGSGCRRLDHDHPVALTSRRQHQAERPLQGSLEFIRFHEPGRGHRAFKPKVRDRSQHDTSLRPVAEERSAQLGRLLADEGQRRHEGRYALFRDVAAGKEHDRLGGGGVAGVPRARVQTRQAFGLARQPLGPQPLHVQLGEAERVLTDADA